MLGSYEEPWDKIQVLTKILSVLKRNFQMAVSPKRNSNCFYSNSVNKSYIFVLYSNVTFLWLFVKHNT